jgi:hypothetical protein
VPVVTILAHVVRASSTSGATAPDLLPRVRYGCIRDCRFEGAIGRSITPGALRDMGDFLAVLILPVAGNFLSLIGV